GGSSRPPPRPRRTTERRGGRSGTRRGHRSGRTRRSRTHRELPSRSRLRSPRARSARARAPPPQWRGRCWHVSWIPRVAWDKPNPPRHAVPAHASGGVSPVAWGGVSTTPTRVYVARLVGLPIFDPQGDQVGKVRDLVVTVRSEASPPRVLGLVAE